MKTVPVTITSDFICPWCFIGELRLARAAVRLSEDVGEEFRLDISWRPFELNPDIPAEGIDRRAYRIAKFGSWEYSQRLDANVIEAGKQDGAIFNYDRISRTPNTRRAHRLVWWAIRNGNPDSLVDRLFKAYFVEGRDLSSPAELAGIAAKAVFRRMPRPNFLRVTKGRIRSSPRRPKHTGTGFTAFPIFASARSAFPGRSRLRS